MSGKSRVVFCVSLAVALPIAGQAGWFDDLKKQGEALFSQQKEAPVEAPLSALSQDEMVQGLKQALDKGVRYAVNHLGAQDGFLNNAKVRIPIPRKLQWVEKNLRRFGQDKLADDFVLSMNRAAERAMPATLEVFGDAIRKMSLEDAKAILQGPDDAATQYFRRTSDTGLAARIRPIVDEATSEVGVTKAYKAFVGQSDVLGGLVDRDDLDLDAYVTRKALDGVYLMVAEEERKIRENPVERTTDLLKKVFGAQ